MRTIAIKMKNYRSGVRVVNNNDIQRRLLHIFLASFGVLALLYVLFLGNMVFSIVERRTLEADARTLSSEVMDLESTYLSMSSSVDMAMSSSMGFKETEINFATRKSIKSLGRSPMGEALGVAALKNEI